MNGEDYKEVIKVLDTIVGLYSYSLCKQVAVDYDNIYDKIKDEAVKLINEEISLSKNKVPAPWINWNDCLSSLKYTKWLIFYFVKKAKLKKFLYR